VPEAWSKAFLARVLAAAGPGGGGAADRSEAIVSAPDEQSIVLDAAAVDLAARHPSVARERLERMLADPRHTSAPERLRARLLLGRAELAGGRAAAGRALSP